MSTVSDSSSYSNSLQNIRDSYENELAQTRSRHQKETQKLEEENEKQLKAVKEDYQKKLVEEKESAREEVRKLKEEMYDSSGKRSQELQERSSDRAALQEFREQIEKETNQKIERIEENARSRIEKTDQDAALRVENALKAQNQSHVEESKGMRDELAIYWNEGRDLAAEKNQARNEVIQSYERDHLHEKENLVNSYERTLGRMREHEQELQNHYGRKLTDLTQEANSNARKAVNQQKAEFTRLSHEQTKDLERVERSLRDEVSAERIRNAQVQRDIMDHNHQDMGRALDEKDKAYGSYLQENAKRVRSELQAREDIIRDLRTTSDPKKVSPSIIHKIETREEGRYHDQLTRLRESEKANLDALRATDHDARVELKNELEQQVREQNRNQQRENDLQKRSFFSNYQDLKDHHQSEVSQITERAGKAIERLHQDQSRALVEEQGRRKDALLEQRESLKSERDHEVEDLALNQKLQDREWMIRLNDQRREYERQMEQERDLHERQLSETKLEAEKKFRDQERTAKRLLDEKDRNVEHQVRQQELTYREKERFLIEHYESELDKMKRTNAQLIAKKS